MWLILTALSHPLTTEQHSLTSSVDSPISPHLNKNRHVFHYRMATAIYMHGIPILSDHTGARTSLDNYMYLLPAWPVLIKSFTTYIDFARMPVTTP